jgi:DNA primase
LSDRKIAEYGFKEPQKVAGIVVPGQWALELQSRHEPSAKSIPEEHLKPFVLSRKALAYLKDRGLCEKSIREWELGWHERAQRIVIPIRDTENRLVGISGRAFHSYMKPKFLHSAGFHRDLYLFGEHRIGKNKGATGYLVEGFFDVFLLWQWGYRYPVAMLGSYLSAFQVEKLVNFFDEVVIVPDGDAAGYEAAYRAYGQLHHRIRVRIASVPEGLDPDQLDPTQREKLLGVPSG